MVLFSSRIELHESSLQIGERKKKSDERFLPRELTGIRTGNPEREYRIGRENGKEGNGDEVNDYRCPSLYLHWDPKL